VADQQAGPVADTDAGPTEPTKKQSRAGRNLPAAIAVGAALGFSVIAILVFVPYVWIGVVAVAMVVATHEVVRRLRAAGYAIPVVPLLLGGQAMIWLTWPLGAAGALGAFGGTVGAGWERKITPSWTLKAEYRYTRFQDHTLTTNFNSSSSSTTVFSNNPSSFSSSSFANVDTNRYSGLDWHTVAIGVSHYFDAN